MSHLSIETLVARTQPLTTGEESMLVSGATVSSQPAAEGRPSGPVGWASL